MEDREQLIKDRTEGPLNPLELNRRANISVMNHLVKMRESMLEIYNDMVGLHPETRQVQAEAIDKVETLLAYIDAYPQFNASKLSSILDESSVLEQEPLCLNLRDRENKRYDPCQRKSCPHMRFGHYAGTGECSNVFCNCKEFVGRSTE